MNFHTILHRFVFAAALMGSASLGLVSCGDDAPPSANLGGDSSVEPQNCFRPNTGCECDNEGTTITCRPSENSCEMGTRVCAGGTWSACDTGEVGGSAQGAIGGSQQALQDRDDPCTACQPECVAEKDFDFGHRATSLADDYENVVGITIDSTTIPGRIALLAGSGMPEDLLTWDNAPLGGDGIADYNVNGDGTADDPQAAELGWDPMTHTWGIAPNDGSAWTIANNVNGDPGYEHVFVPAAPSPPPPLDAYFLVEASPQALPLLSVLDTNFDSVFLPEVENNFPGSRGGLGFFSDFPINPYGAETASPPLYADVVYHHYASMNGLNPVPALFNTPFSSPASGPAVLRAGPQSNFPGGDIYTSGLQALWMMTTGMDIGNYSIGSPSCAAGEIGHPCFASAEEKFVFLVMARPPHNDTNIAGSEYANPLQEPGTGPSPEVAPTFPTTPSDIGTAGNNATNAYALTPAGQYVSKTITTDDAPKGPCQGGGPDGQDAVFRFYAQAGYKYHIEVLNRTFGTNNSVYIAQNAGGVIGASVTTPTSCWVANGNAIETGGEAWIAPATGNYYLIVNHRNNGGSFELRFGEYTPPSPGTPGPTVPQKFYNTEVLAQLAGNGIRVVPIYTDATVTPFANQIATDTGAVRADATALAFQVNADGSNLVSEFTGIVMPDVLAVATSPATKRYEASVVGGLPTDLSVVLTPTNAGACAGPGYTDCPANHNMSWSLTYSLGMGYALEPFPQQINFNVQIHEFLDGIDQGVVDMIPVTLVVPPSGVAVTGFSSGTFERRYRGCHPQLTSRTDWDEFSYDFNIPANTSIEVEFSTSEDENDFSDATSSVYTFGPADSGTGVVNLAVPDASGEPAVLGYRYLRTRFTLRSMDGVNTPTIAAFEQRFYCYDEDGGIPENPDCGDGTAGPGETGADCGGICAQDVLGNNRCGDGMTCWVGNDCTSGVCTSASNANGTCTMAGCADGVLNGGESDIDCGSVCPVGSRCQVGEDCFVNADCESPLSCSAGTCIYDVCFAQVQIPPNQCQELVDLYNATGGGMSWADEAGQTTSNGWSEINTPPPGLPQPCDWLGVTCAGGNVVGIDLRGNNLTGALPSAWLASGMSNLQDLRLSNNSISGPFPASVGTVTSLTALWIGEATTDANNWGALPNLSGLTNLQAFVARNCGIGGAGSNIPSWIGSLTSLVYLDLRNNGIEGTIPTTLGTLPNLTTLFLNQNALTGSIPASFSLLGDTIDTFHLNDNQLSGVVPFDDADFVNFPADGSLANQFSLYNNDCFFAQSVAHAQWLDMQDPPGLMGWKNGCVTPCELQSVVPYSECLAIEDLYNFAGGTNWPTNYDAWDQIVVPGANINLCDGTWNVSGVGLTCTAPGSSCVSDGFYHIDTLNIPYNSQLQGSLSASIGNLTCADSIQIYGLGNLTNLPPEIGSLTNLRTLYLGNVGLDGPLPATLANLSNATSINLGGNNLTGTLPSGLTTLANLEYLMLTGNALSGNIPVGFGANGTLRWLMLRNNNLSGTIPAGIGNLGSARSATESLIIDVANNALTGPVPPSLANFGVAGGNAHHLLLENNDLSGTIPANLGDNLASLETLDLSGNQLTGAVPASLANIVNDVGDGQIRLRNNLLSGELPAAFEPNISAGQNSLLVTGNRCLYAQDATLVAAMDATEPGWENGCEVAANVPACVNAANDSGIHPVLETGTDCGAFCASYYGRLCPAGEGCVAATDCADGICNAGTCAECLVDDDCPNVASDLVCQANSCDPLFVDFQVLAPNVRPGESLPVQYATNANGPVNFTFDFGGPLSCSFTSPGPGTYVDNCFIDPATTTGPKFGNAVAFYRGVGAAAGGGPFTVVECYNDAECGGVGYCDTGTNMCVPPAVNFTAPTTGTMFTLGEVIRSTGTTNPTRTMAGAGVQVTVTVTDDFGTSHTCTDADLTWVGDSWACDLDSAALLPHFQPGNLTFTATVTYNGGSGAAGPFTRTLLPAKSGCDVKYSTALLCDGFESGSIGPWTSTSQLNVINSPVQRGDYALRSTTAAGESGRLAGGYTPSATGQLNARFYMYVPTAADINSGIRLLDINGGGNPRILLQIPQIANNEDRIGIFGGTTSGAGAFQRNQWVCMTMQMVDAGPSSVQVTARVNGTVVSTANIAGNLGTYNGVAWGSIHNQWPSQNGVTLYFDEFVLDDQPVACD